MSDANGDLLSGRDIEILLNEIGEILAQSGQIAEFAIFGGSAIALMFDFRDSTRDVDFMPVSGDMSTLKAAVSKVGGKYGLDDGWFNDAIEIFASDTPSYRLQGEYPVGKPGVRVFTATPEYLLSMKILSMRSSLVSSDVKDVWHLIDELGVKSCDEALDVVRKYYPDKEVSERNRLILMDVFDSKESNQPYNTLLGW